MAKPGVIRSTSAEATMINAVSPAFTSANFFGSDSEYGLIEGKDAVNAASANRIQRIVSIIIIRR